MWYQPKEITQYLLGFKTDWYLEGCNNQNKQKKNSNKTKKKQNKTKNNPPPQQIKYQPLV